MALEGLAQMVAEVGNRPPSLSLVGLESVLERPFDICLDAAELRQKWARKLPSSLSEEIYRMLSRPVVLNPALCSQAVMREISPEQALKYAREVEAEELAVTNHKLIRKPKKMKHENGVVVSSFAAAAASAAIASAAAAAIAASPSFPAAATITAASPSSSSVAGAAAKIDSSPPSNAFVHPLKFFPNAIITTADTTTSSVFSSAPSTPPRRTSALSPPSTPPTPPSTATMAMTAAATDVSAAATSASLDQALTAPATSVTVATTDAAPAISATVASTTTATTSAFYNQTHTAHTNTTTAATTTANATPVSAFAPSSAFATTTTTKTTTTATAITTASTTTVTTSTVTATDKAAYPVETETKVSTTLTPAIRKVWAEMNTQSASTPFLSSAHLQCKRAVAEEQKRYVRWIKSQVGNERYHYIHPQVLSFLTAHFTALQQHALALYPPFYEHIAVLPPLSTLTLVSDVYILKSGKHLRSEGSLTSLPSPSIFLNKNIMLNYLESLSTSSTSSTSSSKPVLSQDPYVRTHLPLVQVALSASVLAALFDIEKESVWNIPFEIVETPSPLSQGVKIESMAAAAATATTTTTMRKSVIMDRPLPRNYNRREMNEKFFQRALKHSLNATSKNMHYDIWKLADLAILIRCRKHVEDTSAGVCCTVNTKLHYLLPKTNAEKANTQCFGPEIFTPREISRAWIRTCFRPHRSNRVLVGHVDVSSPNASLSELSIGKLLSVECWRLSETVMRKDLEGFSHELAMQRVHFIVQQLLEYSPGKYILQKNAGENRLRVFRGHMTRNVPLPFAVSANNSASLASSPASSPLSSNVSNSSVPSFTLDIPPALAAAESRPITSSVVTSSSLSSELPSSNAVSSSVAAVHENMSLRTLSEFCPIPRDTGTQMKVFIPPVWRPCGIPQPAALLNDESKHSHFELASYVPPNVAQIPQTFPPFTPNIDLVNTHCQSFFETAGCSDFPDCPLLHFRVQYVTNYCRSFLAGKCTKKDCAYRHLTYDQLAAEQKQVIATKHPNKNRGNNQNMSHKKRGGNHNETQGNSGNKSSQKKKSFKLNMQKQA